MKSQAFGQKLPSHETHHLVGTRQEGPELVWWRDAFNIFGWTVVLDVFESMVSKKELGACFQGCLSQVSFGRYADLFSHGLAKEHPGKGCPGLGFGPWVCGFSASNMSCMFSCWCHTQLSSWGCLILGQSQKLLVSFLVFLSNQPYGGSQKHMPR